MRIAQVAPLFERVPPRGYGGTERVVSYLTEALVQLGHDVTLFATADSLTSARLRPQLVPPMRMASCADPLPDHLVMFEQVSDDVDQFDLVHFHTDVSHFPIAARLPVPHVTTVHGRLDLPAIERLFRTYGHLPFISISHSQQRPMPWLNWTARIHHGLPHDLYRPQSPADEDYLLFVGRISPEKRVDRAIAIAGRAGMPLRVAAKIGRVDRAYFESEIKSLFDLPFVDYLGEVGDAEKGALLAGARALLFPIDWPEPFGLVLIEAMACGTPVIAYPAGSVPEILEHGKTGFLVESIDQAVEAVDTLAAIDRKQCRDEFERRFTAARMAEQHLALYRQLIGTWHADVSKNRLPRSSALRSAR